MLYDINFKLICEQLKYLTVISSPLFISNITLLQEKILIGRVWMSKWGLYFKGWAAFSSYT